MQDIFNSLASKVNDVMEAYAEEHGLTLILDISQQQSPVLYASNGSNITTEVIDAYNAKSGVPSASGAAGGAPGAQSRPSAPATHPAPSTPKPAAH